MIRELILNKPPIRTANNFEMNNVVIKEDMPYEIGRFKNIEIENKENSKIIIDNQKLDVFSNSNYEIKYGVGEELLKEIEESANNRIFIHITKKLEHTIVVEYRFDKDNKNLVNDINIEAEEGTKAKILIKYIGSIGKFYHNGLVRINAKKDSDIEIGVVNLLNITSDNFTSFDNTIGENARLEYTLIELGGKNNVSNWYSKVNGNNAECKLETIYLGIENQLIDLNYIGELYSPKSQIQIDVQGVLKDETKKNFKGTIDFKTGAKEAKGAENESCILLSDKARSKALPILLCTEDDVEGEHSTGSGKIENEKLFYLMSRGFSKKEAIKLIVRAKFDNILSNIDDNEEIWNEIDRRLD